MSCSNQAFSDNIDVNVDITLSGAVANLTNNIAVFLSYEANLPSYNRLQYFTSSSEVLTNFGSNSEEYKAANIYFAQTRGSNEMAIGQLFDTNQPASLLGQQLGSLASFQLIHEGAFSITMSGGTPATFEFTYLDFALALSYVDVAAIIQAALNEISASVANSSFTNATVTIDEESTFERIIINTGSIGSESEISVLSTVTTPTSISGPSYLNEITGVAGTIVDFKAISNGGFVINFDSVLRQIRQLDFTNVTDYDDIAAIIQTAIRNYGGLINFQDAIVTASSATAPATFSITNGAVTVVAIVDDLYALVAEDVSGVDYLNADSVNGKPHNGYSSGTFIEEVGAVRTVSLCASNSYIYAWTLSNKANSDANILALTAWGQSINNIIVPIVSQSSGIADNLDTDDPASEMEKLEYNKSFIFYMDNDSYTQIAITSILQAVDRDGINTSTTAFGKILIGIIPINSNDVELLETLSNKRCNTYLAKLSNINEVYEGIMPNQVWRIEDRYDLDAFALDIQNALTNLLSTASNSGTKIPYDQSGFNQIMSVTAEVCEKYKTNGLLVERNEKNLAKRSGYETFPAYSFSGFYNDAALRTSGKVAFVITANLSGSIINIQVNLDAYK